MKLLCPKCHQEYDWGDNLTAYDLAEKGSKDYSVKLTFKISKNGVIKIIKQEII